MGRRKFDTEFKKNAVSLFLSSGKSAKEIAENLGINSAYLYQWNKKFSFKKFEIETDEELKKLRKEVIELKLERDILKKAMAIFSQPQK